MLYVVMWEAYQHDHGCVGGDLFYTLDEDKATDFMHAVDKSDDLSWDAEAEMYTDDYKWSWYKIYVDERPLNKEL